MVVQHHVEPVVDAVVHHLFHSVHPLAVYLVGVCIADMSVSPGTRDADTFEAQTLHVVDDCLGGLRTLPGCLCTQSALVVQEVHASPCGNTLQRIAEVPPWSHIVNHFNTGTVKSVLSFRCCHQQQAQYGQEQCVSFHN